MNSGSITGVMQRGGRAKKIGERAFRKKNQIQMKRTAWRVLQNKALRRRDKHSPQGPNQADGQSEGPHGRLSSHGVGSRVRGGKEVSPP